MNCISVSFKTADMLTVTGVALPWGFEFARGSRVQVTFPDGRRGTLAMLSARRAKWSSEGSRYDGREFDVTPKRWAEGDLGVALVQLAA